MHLTDTRPVASTTATTGTVEVSFSTEASCEQAWNALTEPALLHQWFGTMLPAPVPNGRSRLDFGDGDFFDLEVDRVEPLHTLQYRWRFLGIGPEDHISWHVTPLRTGCRVAVTDEESLRSPGWADELREGWLDFTQRLQQFLATARPTRYDWRRDFEGGIELPTAPSEAWNRLFDPSQQSLWLPVDEPVDDGGSLHPADGRQPDPLQIIDVQREHGHRLTLLVAHSSWQQPTRCNLMVVPRADRSLLMLSHTGWSEIDPDEDEQRRQRRRFSELWIGVLQRAHRHLAHAADRPLP